MTLRILFFGGNGHSAARLTPAIQALATPGAPPMTLQSVPYPGFEGRPRASSFDTFLDEVAAAADALRAPPGEPASSTILYATGVGGLLVLSLRAKGALRDVPALFQAPVLWGLERRLMPRVMRLGLAQIALRRAFASPFFQRRFTRKHFLHPPPEAVISDFFNGYAACAALPDFFDWLTPSLLRSLEARLKDDPSLLDKITFLWGERDTVVPPAEIAWTEQAIGHALPVLRFEGWGHYPMIDDPQAWVREVYRVATAASL